MDIDFGGELNPNIRFVLTVLSVTVIVNTFIYKVPQMYNILSSGSSENVSLPSVVLEWTAYSIMLTYQFAMQFPFETYAENTMMVFQDCMLTFVILQNRDMIGSYLIPLLSLYFVGFVSIAMYWLPDILMTFLIGSTTPILCYSKMDQLFRILWAQDAGVVSSLTWFIVCYDTAVRMLTTAIITKDIPMFINLTSSEILNVAIFVSIIYFNNLELKAARRRRTQ